MDLGHIQILPFYRRKEDLSILLSAKGPGINPQYIPKENCSFILENIIISAVQAVSIHFGDQKSKLL